MKILDHFVEKKGPLHGFIYIKEHGIRLIVIHFKDKVDNEYVKQKLSTKQ